MEDGIDLQILHDRCAENDDRSADQNGNTGKHRSDTENIASKRREVTLAEDLGNVDCKSCRNAADERKQCCIERACRTDRTESVFADKFSRDHGVNRAVGKGKEGGKNHGDCIKQKVAIDISLGQIFCGLHGNVSPLHHGRDLVLSIARFLSVSRGILKKENRHKACAVDGYDAFMG